MIMDKEELLKNYPPHKVKTQGEFDKWMQELNEHQTHLNHPYNDQLVELKKQRMLIFQQIQSLRIQNNAIGMQMYDLMQKKKDINRICHDLKHEMIELNPIGGFGKQEA